MYSNLYNPLPNTFEQQLIIFGIKSILIHMSIPNYLIPFIIAFIL
jgi:hypothetical protein